MDAKWIYTDRTQGSSYVIPAPGTRQHARQDMTSHLDLMLRSAVLQRPAEFRLRSREFAVTCGGQNAFYVSI